MNDDIQNRNNEPYEEYELPLLRIEDEEGNEMNYVCLQELELNSKKYLITMEMESEDEEDETLENPFADEEDELEVFVFIEEGEENGNRIISIVEDDDEFNAVVEAWNKIIENESEHTNPTNTQ